MRFADGRVGRVGRNAAAVVGDREPGVAIA